MNFVDSHCHLHFERIAKLLPKILNESTSHGVSHFVVNSTSPKDFDLVLNLCNKHSNITPCFGIHPYYIDSHSIDDSLNSLYRICNEMKRSYCIGEIGMDKSRIKECPMDLQEYVFRKQIQFAVSKSAVFCVHCVKCVGLVYDVLKSELSSPYPFLMHGFSGSADYVDKFVKLGSYFSISNYLFNLSPNRRRAIEETIKKIPLDRLLFESDAPDMVLILYAFLY